MLLLLSPLSLGRAHSKARRLCILSVSVLASLIIWAGQDARHHRILSLCCCKVASAAMQAYSGNAGYSLITHEGERDTSD